MKFGARCTPLLPFISQLTYKPTSDASRCPARWRRWEDARALHRVHEAWPSCMGGVFFLFRGGKLNALKITKIKYDEGLRWLPFDILSRNNQPKTRGRDGGGMG
jgi:hypothetical protein